MEDTKKNKPVLHLMVDIETLATSNDALMLSYAMKSFKLKNDDVDLELTLQCHIDVLSSLLYARKVDEDTLAWWRAEERNEARLKMLEDNGESSILEYAMWELYNKLNKLNEEYEIYYWGRGAATFDMPILSENMRAVIGEKYKEPWKFWQIMDVRSIVRIANWAGMKTEETKALHSALEDVEKQIAEVRAAWEFMAMHNS